MYLSTINGPHAVAQHGNLAFTAGSALLGTRPRGIVNVIPRVERSTQASEVFPYSFPVLAPILCHFDTALGLMALD